MLVHPLISCIMPTRGRPEMAQQALACWRNQHWYPKELVIIDDADCPSFAQPPQIYGVEYHLMSSRMTIAAKRNLAVSRSSGDIICHWDSDDVSMPGRLEDQYRRLEGHGAPITGYHTMLFTDGARWWRYHWEDNYALGTSFMYTKAFWRERPFPAERACVGEDNQFIEHRTNQLVSVDARHMMYVRVHPDNSEKRRMEFVETKPRQYVPVEAPTEFACA